MHNHMHNPDNDEINAVKARASMKRRSQDTAGPTQRILNDSVQDLPQATLANLGKPKQLKEIYAVNAGLMSRMSLGVTTICLLFLVNIR